jgi:hypothetical protein
MLDDQNPKKETATRSAMKIKRSKPVIAAGGSLLGTNLGSKGKTGRILGGRAITFPHFPFL